MSESQNDVAEVKSNTHDAELSEVIETGKTEDEIHLVEKELKPSYEEVGVEGSSAIYNANSTELLNVSDEESELEQAMNMSWTFGYNCNLPVINLYGDKTRTSVVYASSQVVVVYDYTKNKQVLLQGHVNAITHLCSSGDRRWLVTCDKGKNACIIVWDTFTGIPVQTIFDVVDGDEFISAIDISHDAKYICAISQHNTHQNVLIWDWTVSSVAVLKLELKHRQLKGQKKVSFHSEDPHLIVSNSDTQVIFYSWRSGKLKCDTPALNDSTFNKSVGLFNNSLFQHSPKDICLTSTLNGHVAVWNPNRSVQKKGLVKSYKRRPHKMIRLSQRGITAMQQTHDGLVVIGDSGGCIKFFDANLMMLHYLDNKHKLGQIVSLSFDTGRDHHLELVDNEQGFPTDVTINQPPFVVPTCVVSTSHGQMVNYQPNGCRMDNLLTECSSPFHCISASPNKSLLCIGSKNGMVKVCDYDKKEVIATRLFTQVKGHGVNCLAFNHDSSLIACGFMDGSVSILDANCLNIEINFNFSRESITKMAFSHQSKYLATADACFTVTVFEKTPNKWRCLGRYKSHYDVINDMMFCVDDETQECRLITLGSDRNMVEYDLANSSNDTLSLKSIHRIEQTALPLSLEFYPSNVMRNGTNELFLLTSNNQHKLKLYNSTTKMCRYTFLAPTFDSPIYSLKIVPAVSRKEDDFDYKRVLCYSTDTKVGLQLLPLDGSQHRSVGVTGQPGHEGLSQVECSHDGRFVFAASSVNASVHMWKINYDALEAIDRLEGEGLDPFYELLEGGREGELMREIVDMFYYAQIRDQGEDSMDVRKACDFIKLEQIPNIMRSLGFYPSEQEIEDMINEVKFRDYAKTNKYVTKINLDDFIKLYINHRPAFGLSVNELTRAFKILNSQQEKPHVMNRNYLLHVLQHLGEHLTHEEMAECLYCLLGQEVAEKMAEKEVTMDTDDESTDPNHPSYFMPEDVTSEYLINYLLALNTSNKKPSANGERGKSAISTNENRAISANQGDRV